MRAPSLPTLIVLATFVGCAFMLVTLSNNSGLRRHHSAHLTIPYHSSEHYRDNQNDDDDGDGDGNEQYHHGHHYHRSNADHHDNSASPKPHQVEELSVLDPVAMKLENITDLSSNKSNKVPIIQEKTIQAEEKKDSLAVFFILFIIVLATLVVHMLIMTEFRYMPESLAIVLLGAFIGFVLSYSRWDWREVETFNPNLFFLVLLPPIIFESGYTVNKGNFFTNIVPIFTFAILGTFITSLIISSGIYFLGMSGLVYRLSLIESITYGSILSAVDPVITLAIFQALKVNHKLYIMVFGESMLNDCVAILMASTAIEMNSVDVSHLSKIAICQYAIYRFLSMFFVSALLGWAIGIISSLLYKHVQLRKTPALEMALLLVFAYLPYGLAEALSLSGIMAILFCSITMSQYTHYNLTPITQLTMQMTFRTLSFVAETCTFAYLGLALFSIKLVFQPVFLLWSIILIFVSRAANIFPLSFLVNKCLHNKISMKNQIIMWFSGMRGAVAFALALHMNVENMENKRMLLTSTLFVVLFTIIFMGGSALPLLRILDRLFPNDDDDSLQHDTLVKRRSQTNETSGSHSSRRKMVLSKTQEMNLFDQKDYGDHENREDSHKNLTQRIYLRKNFFTRLNERIVRPFLIRNITKEEIAEDRQRLRQMTEALRLDLLQHDFPSHHSTICAYDVDEEGHDSNRECLDKATRALLPSTSSPRS